MLEMEIRLNGDLQEWEVRLKKWFEKSRPLLFRKRDGALVIEFEGSTESWRELWAAIWSLTKEERFVSAITDWKLIAEENGETFSENLLEYCQKRGKGLFKSRR
ncbi:MAG: hypothetical protein ACI4J1_06400 [Ruminiclostridium sp.]